MLHKLIKNKNFLAAIGSLETNVEKWKLLGRGAYGYAYDMGDGRVCKITTNKNETKTAAKLAISNKKYTYLYKVLDVLEVRKKKEFWLGLIITPKYRKLTDNQKVELYELFCFLNLGPNFRIKSMDQIKQRLSKAVNNYFYLPYPYTGGGVADNMIAKRLKIFKKYNILHILRNLKAANLGPRDMHYDNILMHNGKFILIDIAC